MKRFKFILLGGLFVALLAPALLAAGTNGTVVINANTSTYYLKDSNNAIVKPDQEPPAAPANILFFTSSPQPTANASGIAPAILSGGGSDPYKYDFTGSDGTPIYLLAKAGDHYGIYNKGYYFNTAKNAKEEAPITLSASNPQQYELDFKTDWQMATPYKPSSLSVTESQQRVGETTQTKLTLKISITVGNGSSPNYRKVTGYKFYIAKAGETNAATAVSSGTFALDGPVLATTTGSSITVTTGTNDYLTAGNQYKIIAWGTNDWTVDNDNNLASLDNKLEQSWTTLAGLALTEVVKTWTFAKPTDKTGVNTFAVPFIDLAKVKRVAGETETVVDISTIGKLIKELNAQAGETPAVTVFGWYDESTQTHIGITSVTEYNNDGTVKSAKVTGDTLENILGGAVKLDRPYQVSVNKQVEVKIKGYRQ